MAAESHVAEVCAVLCLLVRAMVDKPEEVSITPLQQSKSVVFHIEVAPCDWGKLIGKSGRTARSLRIILSAISNAQGQQYLLDVHGASDLTIPAAQNQLSSASN